MRRRALLSLVGVAAAGCIDASGRDPTTTATDADPTTTSGTPLGPTDEDAPERPTVTGTPPDVGVPPSESACPGGRRIARIVCVPEVDPESEPIAMTADAGAGSLPEASFSFTLRNDTETRLNINFYQWRVWKRVDGEWFHVAPRGWPEPLHRLPPDGAHEWSLTCRSALPDHSRGAVAGSEGGGEVAGLGGGDYAFTTQGWFEGATYEGQTRFAVRFFLEGPPVELEPTDAVTGHSRGGDTVTVRGDSGADGEDSRQAAFVLTVVDDADTDTVTDTDGADTDGGATRRLLPEQAARDFRLRNTLPYFADGVTEVRYVEQNRTVPAFGVNEPYTIQYDGQTYRVTAEELGDGA